MVACVNLRRRRAPVRGQPIEARSLPIVLGKLSGKCCSCKAAQRYGVDASRLRGRRLGRGHDVAATWAHHGRAAVMCVEAAL
jgi:hypothetical protein